ncbi:MAG: hypothetical protein R3E31_00085 [Chloroflexota bacterium]
MPVGPCKSKRYADFWKAILVGFSKKDYDNMVCGFLQEPVGAHEKLRGKEYRSTYAHLLYGSILSILRPNPRLYPIVLKGALGIADPSSIQYGAYALRQMKPLEQIVEDLRNFTKENQTDKETLSHVAWLLYWFGFSTEGWWRMPNYAISIDNVFTPLITDWSLPTIDRQAVENMADWASEIMKLHYGGT